MEVLVKTLYQRGRTFQVTAFYDSKSDLMNQESPLYYEIYEENELGEWEFIEGVKFSELPSDRTIVEFFEFRKRFPLIVLN